MASMKRGAPALRASRLMATIHDVAQRAGVSAGTVSNVLNRPSYVSADTRQRVLDAIERARLRAERVVPAVPAGRGRTIGMVVADLGNPFFVDVALGAEAMAREAGAGLVVCNSAEDAVREEHNLDLLVQQRVQGVLITPVDERREPAAGRAARARRAGGPPRPGLPHCRNCCSCTTNDVYGGQLAGEHLVERGHERSPRRRPVRRPADRATGRAGFPRSGGRRDRAVEGRLRELNCGLDVGRAAGKELAERPRRPAADRRLLRERPAGHRGPAGADAPQDRRSRGHRDRRLRRPGLGRGGRGAAVVGAPAAEQLGRAASRLVMAEIDEGGRHQHEHVTFQPELIVRDSSDITVTR